MSNARDEAKRASSIPVEEIDLSEGMYRFFLAGDRARAVELASAILARRPDDAVAASVVAQCMAPPGLDDIESAAVSLPMPKPDV